MMDGSYECGAGAIKVPIVFVKESPDWVVKDMLMSADVIKLWARINHFELANSVSLQDDQIKLLATWHRQKNVCYSH